MKQEKLSIRPYARLLTMLGDQLIRNERVALVELIKNSYDADADWVEVRFEDFNDDMSANEHSRIVIEDNGNGMKPDEIRKSWMNPATPHKYLKKKYEKNKTPAKGRIMQGEKGIGRFAIFKLGRAVSVTTRHNSSSFESVIQYDFHNFDDDFISEAGKEKEIFLDEIQATYHEQEPSEIIKNDHGTLIQIRQVKGKWTDKLINILCRDISSLTDPLSRVTGHSATDNFKISVVRNGKVRPVEDDSAEVIRGLIENKPVLKIKGEFNAQKKTFFFMEDEDKSSKTEVGLTDSKIKGLWIWRQRFGNGKDDGKSNKGDRVSREYECGNFKFRFYIFDFTRGISGKYELNQEDKDMLKKHRVYLYRDGIRVYPYGDPDDDWLNMDVFRGTGKVGDFFSNDQMVGWIDISQQGNPYLRDKTNREGLIEKGNAVSDFVSLIQVILSYIRQRPYARYQQNERDRKVAETVRSDLVTKRLAELKASLERRKYMAGVRDIARIEKEYKREKDYLIQRAETTEDLAGVGLSVEMTSHDLMLMMSRAKDISKEIARLSRNSDDP
ncbi:MAG: ATP-binding protein [Gammaproteobacteria bacterium]|nr:ATP-binding protein [Gammaproteobacteria bacterium]